MTQPFDVHTKASLANATPINAPIPLLLKLFSECKRPLRCSPIRRCSRCTSHACGRTPRPARGTPIGQRASTRQIAHHAAHQVARTPQALAGPPQAPVPCPRVSKERDRPKLAARSWSGKCKKCSQRVPDRGLWQGGRRPSHHGHRTHLLTRVPKMWPGPVPGVRAGPLLVVTRSMMMEGVRVCRQTRLRARLTCA